MDGREETGRVIQAISGLEGVAAVTQGWPKREAVLPCVAVVLAGERGAERRDDAEYLTEVIFYLRIFARTAEGTDALAPSIRRTMADLGYERDFAWEDADERGHYRAERYRAILC